MGMSAKIVTYKLQSVHKKLNFHLMCSTWNSIICQLALTTTKIVRVQNEFLQAVQCTARCTHVRPYCNIPYTKQYR
jgi:hypothetical protein